MMKRMMNKRGVVFAFVILLFLCTNVSGQEKEFPVKPINLYMGYSPGGAGTHVGTVICEGMKKHLKQPVILNFKPGAAQAIAAEFVVNSKPDGYTLLWLNYGDLVGKVAKDGPTLKFGLKDLDTLGSGPYCPYTFAINDKSVWKTIEDLIDAARKSPGKLNFSSTGHGAQNHLLGEYFCQKMGITMNHIPFAGGGAYITALLGGHLDIAIASCTTFGGHIKPGGGLRSLIVFDQGRLLDLPDVPTAIERGIEIPFWASWFGLQAPRGLPKEIKTTLVQAFKKTVEDPQTLTMLNKLVGIKNTYLSPEKVDRQVQDQYKTFQDIFKRLDLTKQK